MLVASEKGRLLAIDERQDLVWESALGQRRLAGPPCVSGGEIFLSARNGTVWRISASDGKELGTAIDAGCPLGTGPLVVGSAGICRRSRREPAGGEAAVTQRLSGKFAVLWGVEARRASEGVAFHAQ